MPEGTEKPQKPPAPTSWIHIDCVLPWYLPCNVPFMFCVCVLQASKFLESDTNMEPIVLIYHIRITSSILCPAAALLIQLEMTGFSALGPKTKNLVVAGGLTGFVLGAYYYTMHAVGGTDELQVAIDKFEDLKKKDAAEASAAANSSAPGSS